MYSKNEDWRQDCFRCTLRGFEMLDRDVEQRQQFLFAAGGKSVPSCFSKQGLSVSLFLQKALPTWRRGFNQLYFSAGMLPADQRSICKHAVEYLRSWSDLLCVMRLRIVSWASVKNLEAMRWMRREAVRRRKKKKQTFHPPCSDSVLDADRAAASLLDELQAEQQLKDVRSEKQKRKQKQQRAQTAEQKPTDYVISLLTCPISQV